jgi:hypothetical protein
MRPSWALLRVAYLVAFFGWACGPDHERGRPVHRIYLDDEEPGAAGAAGLPGGSAGSAGAGTQPPEPLPPSVSAMMPLSGPYGTEIRILGSDLGSMARADVSILLGEAEAGELTPTKPEVVSWTESEIRFRFPFPYDGRVLVKTPQGEEVAGEFEPTWLPGPALESVMEVVSTAALAPAAGVIATVLDTGPPSLVTFDGSEWTRTPIAGNNLRADSIRLFIDGETLSAFALSTAAAPEIIALDPADELAQSGSDLEVTTDYRVAGGPDGAAVWYRTGNNWSRARPVAGTWQLDPGSIADPQPNGAWHAAAATSSGGLHVAWGVAEGDLLDDWGEVKHSFLTPEASAFSGHATIGSKMDDSISAIVMSDRGTGLVAQYCGTDQDPFGITASGNLCYSALLPSGTTTTFNEFPSLRYGFASDGSALMAYCSETNGTRLVPAVAGGGTTGAQLDALAGDVVAWPCVNVVALEVDPEGTPLLVIEQAGKLYSPRARVE